MSNVEVGERSFLSSVQVPDATVEVDSSSASEPNRRPAGSESIAKDTRGARSPAERWSEKPKALWRLPTVKQVTGLGRSSIYDRMKKGTFPEAIDLDGGPMVAWISTEVESWVDDQIAVSRKAS